MNDAICAVATPNGHGAIGIIRLSGNNCHNLLFRIFQPNNKTLKVDGIKLSSAIYGKIIWQDQLIDDVIVLIFNGNKSFTGEEAAEIQAHGNPLILRKIIQILFHIGFRQSNPGEFTYRAYLAGKIDLTQAEAIKEIVEARSDRQLNRALMQKEGLLKKRINQFRSDILNIAADITAELDFSDEALDLSSNEQKIQYLQKISAEAIALIEQSRRNAIYKNGVEIVMLGAPNVGKSSLMNAMTGKNRSIVSNIPGTTRDYIDAAMEISGVPVVLVDTAGIRKNQSDEMEKMGIEKTIEKFQEADIRLMIIDASVTPGENSFQDLKLFLHNDFLHKSIIVLNKWDIVQSQWQENVDNELFWNQLIRQSELNDSLIFNDWKKNIISISAKSTYGLEDLFAKLQQIIENLIPQSDSMALSEWQIEIMEKIHQHLNESMNYILSNVSSEIIVENLNMAMTCLSEITGEITNEDLLGRIFSRFCIGK